MNKIIKTLIFVLSWVLLCDSAWQNLKWARKRRLDTDVAKEDLSHFLDDILSKQKEEAKDQSSCVSRIEEGNGIILRTKDSLNRGAKFLKAPDEAKTAADCKQACCAAATEDPFTACDLAVYQESGYDDSEKQARCFLFSCGKGGEDACLTSPNKDYSVFKVKKEKVEAQLLDVATMASETAENGAQAEQKNQHGPCETQFTKELGSIIKTRESIENGAKFLGAPKDVSTADDCRSHCCGMKTEGAMRHCDMAVFQVNDDDPNDRQARCYLFSCSAENGGESKCITSPNGDYVVMKRKVDVEEDQLVNIATSTTSKHTTTTGATRSVANASTPAATKSASTSTVTTTTSTTAKTTVASKVSLEQVHRSKSCGRLEWQCRNDECVKVTDVCNGRADCSDASDEDNMCKTLKSETDNELTGVAFSHSLTAAKVTNPVSTSTASVPKNVETAKAFPELSDGLTGERTEPQRGAVLPLALGLSVTACVLLMVVCRMRIMKNKLRRRGKPLAMEESDYLINGMYL